jgi:hypothetical protein
MALLLSRHDGDSLAGGDVSGRIVLWRNVKRAVADAANPSTKQAVAPAVVAAATVHWHAGPLTSLSFSADSMYLLSGKLRRGRVLSVSVLPFKRWSCGAVELQEGRRASWWCGNCRRVGALTCRA